MTADKIVESVARALWQAESMRATDKPRRIEWENESDTVRAAWRYMARAAIEAHTAALAADGYAIVPKAKA